MKHAYCSIICCLAFVALLYCLGTVAHAAALDSAATITAAPTTVIDPATQNSVLGFFLDLAIHHAWFATVLSIMGLSRVWAKPLSSFIHFVADLTPSPYDNGIINSAMLFFTTNPIGKFLAYLFDWLTSIKITPPKA